MANPKSITGISWTTGSDVDRETLRSSLREFEYDEVESNSDLGGLQDVAWFVALSGPAAYELVRFVDTRLREWHERKLVKNLRVEPDGAISADVTTPDAIVAVLTAQAELARRT
jgi:hypothetical protein